MTTPRTHTRLLVLALPLVFPHLGALAARAAERDVTVEEVMDEVGKRVADLFSDRTDKTGPIDVSPLRDKSEDAPTAGTELTLKLREALEKNGLRLKRGALHVISGRYEVMRDIRSRKPFIDIEVSVALHDGAGPPKIVSINKMVPELKKITDPKPIVSAIGATGEPPRPTPDPEQQGKDVAGIGDNPSTMLEPSDPARPGSPTRVTTRENGAYALELIVNDKPVALTLEKGVAFANLEYGQHFKVNVINRSKNHAAVSLLIDGVNYFTFSEVKDARGAKPLYTHLVVPPTSIRPNWVISGWHKNDAESYAFKVSDFTASAAGQLKNDAGKALNQAADPEIGTVTAVFANAWSEQEKKPDDEPVTKSLATEVGPRITEKEALVRGNYFFGVVRSYITIRYTKRAPSPSARASNEQAKASGPATTPPPPAPQPPAPGAAR